MSVVARDPWADAWQAATQPVLDRGLVSLRRRIWVRRVVGLVVGGAVLLGIAWTSNAAFLPEYDFLWRTPRSLVIAGFSLAGAGLVLMCVAAARSAGRSTLERAFVGPEDYLGRSDRAWVKAQIAEGNAVPVERWDVVAATARRMRAEGIQTLSYLGLLCLCVGMLVGAPILSSLIVFAALAALMLVRIVRGLTWSRRARRWLTRYGAGPS